MPHAELKYSSDLIFDAPALLRKVEETIQAKDSGSGACKGRAYPCDHVHHTHVLLEVCMLPKAHRDAAFIQSLLSDLQDVLKSHIAQSCHMSLGIRFSDGGYITGVHVVDGVEPD